MDTLPFIDSVVAQLRSVREKSLQERNHRQRPPKLPSQKALVHILEQLGAALFPNRLGSPDLHDNSIDYFVGHTLDNLLRQLQKQVNLELRFVGRHGDVSQAGDQSAQITRDFAAQLPTIRQLIETDIQAAFEGDPAASSPDEVLLCYPGITAIMHHRFAHGLYRLGAPLVARIITEIAHSATGIDIHPGAEIADSFFIDHGTGVVIGETAIIGRRVRIYQAVTLGAKSFAKDENGALIKGQARHPIVEDDVVIYAGATILGRITIGRGSVIGGNVWVTRSVPPHSQVTQGQARSVSFDDGGGI
ncbi:MAG TPA: serine acetyltransferase [Kiritimatiellia bacterium]|nr:serine acetyltransferase [Kiritimatiellia bacterium]